MKGHSLFQYSLVFVLAETRVLMCLRTVQDNPREVFSHHQPEHRDVVVSTGEVMSEAETPIFWPPDVKSSLIRKDRAGKD